MPTVKGELGWVPSESCEAEPVPGPSPGFWGFAGELWGFWLYKRISLVSVPPHQVLCLGGTSLSICFIA